MAKKSKVKALREEVSNLKEQMNYSGGGYDPDADLSASGGGSWFFSPLSRSERELNPFTQQRAWTLAFTQYESNPLAKMVLETTRDYVLGEGVVATANDPDEKVKTAVGQVLDRFWNDDLNNFDIKLFNKVLELGLFGEQIYPVTVNDKDGHVQLGYIDPAHVSAVISDPNNIEKKIAVKVRAKMPGESPTYYKIIGENDDPEGGFYARLITAADGESVVDKDETFPYTGSCFYFAINKVTNSERGRSDLLCLIDWIDAYDQLLFNEMDRATLLKNFVWDVAMTGATDKSIEDYKQKNPAPRPGSVRYHSDKVKWDAVTPDLKTTDAQNLSDLITSYIGTGARMPKTWLNGTMDVNRAAAQELGEPAFKRLTARQKIVKYMIQYILRFQLDQAEIAGTLKKRKNVKGSIRPLPWQFVITMPELRPKDLSGASTTLVNCVNALVQAITGKLLDVQIAQEVLAIVLAHIGVDVDIEQLKKRLADAAELAPALPAPANNNGYPSTNGNATGGNDPMYQTHNGTQYTYNQ